MHCVVPGGGLSPDESRWFPCRKVFFLPVRVLSRLFRRKFLEMLERLRTSGKLFFSGSLAHLKVPRSWKKFVHRLRQTEWVVYSKRPFGGPAQVLKYLARYTHRVAISNRRILSVEGGNVRFRWKDYAHGGKRRVMTLETTEFIRRFLLHVLPQGFVRIRHYGFLSNCSRKKKLELIRRLIPPSSTREPAQTEHTLEPAEPRDDRRCPRCKNGRLVLLEDLPAITTDLRQLDFDFDDTS